MVRDLIEMNKFVCHQQFLTQIDCQSISELHKNILADLKAAIRGMVQIRNNDNIIISTQGSEQSWLIDLRPLFMQKITMQKIAQAFWAYFEQRSPFQLAGLETASIPLLTAIVMTAPEHHQNVSACILRKERKQYGLGKIIEGSANNLPVVLVDDIFNSGTTSAKAMAILFAEGLFVEDIFCVINYENAAGVSWLRKSSVKMTSLFVLNDFNLNLAIPKSTIPKRDYSLIWHKKIAGGRSFNVVPKSSPILAEGRIYRGCDAGVMHCFDAISGEIIWGYQCSGTDKMKGIWSTPAFHNGRIYFGAYNGTVYCLNAANGEEVWSQSCCEWVGASPVVVPKHNVVCIGLEYARPWSHGSLAAFDLDDGEPVWAHEIKGLQHGSPAYWQGGDLILWGTADHEILGLHPASGERQWSFKTRRSVKCAPFIDEKRGWAAFASFDKFIYLVDARTGQKLGEWETGEICYTTPLIVDDRLYCGSGDKNLYIINLTTMLVEKKIDLKARVYSSPKYFGGNIIFGTSGGIVLEIGSDDLEEKGRMMVSDAVTNPILINDSGDLMFISTYMNNLYSIKR